MNCQDSEILEEILKDLLENYEDRIERLKQYIETRDYEALIIEYCRIFEILRTIYGG